MPSAWSLCRPRIRREAPTESASWSARVVAKRRNGRLALGHNQQLAQGGEQAATVASRPLVSHRLPARRADGRLREERNVGVAGDGVHLGPPFASDQRRWMGSIGPQPTWTSLLSRDAGPQRRTTQLSRDERHVRACVIPPTARGILRPVTDSPARIRVLLVDDHAVVRRGLRGFLELQDDIEVVGEGEDGTQAVALAQQHHPDVILMDLLMPKMDGLTAIATIKQASPEVEIVAVTSFIEEEKVTAALEAGASGYLLKDAEAEEVADAIRAAYAGEVHLDPAVARLLAQRMRARKEEQPVEPLTAREKEVLGQLAKGASNKEIAYELDITERTARTHVSNILGKLGLASRTQAALWAVEHKLG